VSHSPSRRGPATLPRANPVISEDVERIVSAQLPWQALSGATVLVTGAAGFLPAYMVETLLFLNSASILAAPARIIGLVRNATRARTRFAPYLQRRDLKIVEQNVADPLRIDAPLDYVIHAASPASPAAYLADPVGTLSANVLGTHHLLNAARTHAVKSFLFFSSGAIYGNLEGKTAPIGEHDMGVLDPADDRASYQESKRMGETMAVAWARQFGVPTRIVRPWHTYGPGMRLDDGRVFADFVRDALNGGPIVVKGDGRARRCFCYLADATLGFFTVLLKGGDGEAYNVANPDGECGIGQLADRLAVLYRDQGLAVAYLNRSRFSGDCLPVTPILPNVGKLERLGWRPTSSIEAGFKRTIDSYRV
jgi:UDP-glucuronate decarboxylase